MPVSIEDARLSLRMNRWEDALAGFAEADRTGPLGPDDLVEYSTAAWFAGDVDAATDLLEKAHARYEQAGRRADAAMTAVRLSRLAMLAVRPSVMAGWIARAQRLLEGEPESGAHAWLTVMRGLVTAFGYGDFAGGVRFADEALRLARQHDVPDVESLALVAKGNMLLRQGAWREGLGLVEEGAAAASSERVEPRTACDVICLSIAAFADLGEYGRADEWIAQADRWMRSRSIYGYRGQCRVHRAELKRLQGEWQEAEREALEACGELERFRMLDSVGFAYYQIGEVRLRLGDLDEAAAAFQRAVEHGHHAQPGTALLALARGSTAEAARMIAASLSAEAGSPASDRLQRPYLLAAQVEIALAGDDLATAERGAAELEAVAAQYECDVLSGLAAAAAGRVALGRGQLEAAAASLRRAARLFQRARVPYEWARARALLARALLAAGDEALARQELTAARSEFERLGAEPDVAAADDSLSGRGEPQRPRPTVKTFMFTDIVSSTQLAGSLGDGAWESVMEWHDRTLRAAFARHGGEEVRHTGDGFFVAFDDAREALRCAVEVQRLLDRNRREHGSALAVRIGLHATAALPHERDYAGQGVHVAARVTALAGADEVLATGATLAGAGGHGLEVSPPRQATLKGVAEPVTVRSVNWA
jgi:class 3 adenylate cyclase